MAPSRIHSSLTRRGLLGTAVGLSVSPWSRAYALQGIYRAPQADYDHADRIIASLPRHSYGDVLQAIERLKDVGTTKEPFNRRWAYFGNPLIVRLWEQVGEKQGGSDCEAWCAIALSWCLKRDGRPIPKTPESSQDFIGYGSKQTVPSINDICVFTDTGDTKHGHVALFRGFDGDQGHVKILGGNQSSGGPTNCPRGQGQSLVSEKTVPLKPGPHWGKTFSGFYRPPPSHA